MALFKIVSPFLSRPLVIAQLIARSIKKQRSVGRIKALAILSQNSANSVFGPIISHFRLKCILSVNFVQNFVQKYVH